MFTLEKFTPMTLDLPTNKSLTDIKIEYRTISKEFIDRYINMNTFGIDNTKSLYHDSALYTICIHQGTNCQFHEVIGHNNFKSKMLELGICHIRYYNIVHTPQPVNRYGILVSAHGQIEINNKTYHMTTSFIIRVFLSNPTITNHIINIFL